MAHSYGTYRGMPACSCLIAWLPVLEAVAQHRGHLAGPLGIWQLRSNGAAASAGVHDDGGAFDLKRWDGWLVALAEELGAACWPRVGPGWDPDHSHGALKGCPDNGPVRYQIEAREDGYNGLGAGGRQGRDSRGPINLPTWQQGLARARNELTPPRRGLGARWPWWPKRWEW